MGAGKQFVQSVQQALERALVGLHHLEASLRHLAGILRQFEQLAHGLGQSFGVIHLAQRSRFAHHRRDFEEVEHVRPHDHRQCQGRRLQWVMPARRHQAAADKSAVGEGIQKQQFTHGVAEQYRGLRGDRVAAGTAHRGKALLLTQFEHRPEALLVTRHQNQQRIGIAVEQLSMRRQHHVIFTFMGARGDPHRALAGAPLRA